jgi:prepilin-type N-terminal cleavage/methylation domain-containing protein/prepilin-type processing-associated H-X9-DG protein
LLIQGNSVMVAVFPGSGRSNTSSSNGFTLVELLIVISIIGILVALTMPAINAAREAGRRAQCSNNLHQLGLACQAFESKFQSYPSGGWGKWWAGVPERGTGPTQPGGWHYNILPFMDQLDLHEMGRNGNKAEGAARVQTVVATFLCPTRHRAVAFPFSSGPYININPPSLIGRSDYAANAGDRFVDPGEFKSPGANNANGTYNTGYPWASVSGTAFSNPAPTGVVFRASALSTAKIKDGLSYSYLIGERFMTIGAYNQGAIENDAGWDSGYDYNTIRWTGSSTASGQSTPLAPSQDRVPKAPQTAAQLAMLFGSAHPAGFHMLFCDGNVRKMNYDIDPVTHMQLGNIADGEPTDLSKLDAGK